MIYYPLSVLMLAEFAILFRLLRSPLLQRLLRMAASGLKFSYVEQPQPDGLAQAFILGRDFIGEDSVCLF